MDAAQLRELQAPLKQRYRDEPGSACVTMSAEADFSAEGALEHAWRLCAISAAAVTASRGLMMREKKMRMGFLGGEGGGGTGA